jgi:hypothetical protein
LVEWELARETCPSATLSTTNPTRPDQGSNPGRCNGKPGTNSLSYGTVTLSEKDRKEKVKLSLQHAVEAHRVMRRRGSHIF